MLCASGLVVLIAPLATRGVPLGLPLAVAAGARWGAGTVYVKWARLGIDPLALAFWQLVIAFVVIAAALLLFDGRLDLDRADARSLLATAISDIVGSGIACASWFAIVRRLSAAIVSLGALGIPVVGVLATVLMVRERPTATGLTGFGLILAASAYAIWVPAVPRARPRPLRTDPFGQFRDARHHGVFRIGERVDHGKMVAGQFGIAGFDLGLAQGVDHGPALALELARF